MAVPLGTAMHSEVLGTRQQFSVRTDAQVFAVVAYALQTTHHSKSHLTRQIRIFTVGLLSTSPSRVAEDVNWCPCRRLQQPFSGCLLRRRLRRARRSNRYEDESTEDSSAKTAAPSEESTSRCPHPRPPRPAKRSQGLPLLRCHHGVFEPLTLGAASPSEASPSMSNPQTSNDYALHQRPTKQ